MTKSTTRGLFRSAALAVAIVSSTTAFAQSEGPGAGGTAHRARPLTVRRPAAVAPAYSRGPEIIVTGPLGVASSLVALPFRVGNAVFPADAPPPVNFVGAPIAAAGELAQTPFQLLAAPFGGLPPL